MKPGGWWHPDGDRIVCDLCPRECTLKDGDRGFCFVRQNVDNQMVLTTYGRSTGFCIDPIEKKPLNHFYPGTSVLSFGTAGCNLGCKFCQNWDISKSREIERLSELAMPEDIAGAAKSLGCHSVAYTYNDPIIWAEYAIETAEACRAEGIKSVAVTAGYITKEARGPFFHAMDAANVDLKAFSEEFYHRITLSHLDPVLDTLKWLKTDTDVWFEITNLIIPDANDSPDELQQMCDWILKSVGDEVPVHFSAFHPDFRMRDRGNTPHETLIAARDIALKTGIKYVYVGNVNDAARQSTYCANCKHVVIQRDWYELGLYALDGNKCQNCGHAIPGKFDAKPGHWGRKRQPVDMRQFTQKVDPLAAALSQANQILGASKPANAVQAVSQAPIATSAQPTSPSQEGQATMATVAPQSVELTDGQKQVVLAAAAEHVMAATMQRRPNLPDLNRVGLSDYPVSGVFVSLKRQGRLRSCCGSFGRTLPLPQAIQEAAHRTATNDPRFPRISPSEIANLDTEVWLLFAPEQVEARGEARIDAITIGKHGLQIIRGDNRGLLLPGVATDNHWNAEVFLDNVCIKAGLPPTAWRDDDTTLFRFGGEVIRGPLLSEQDAGELTAPNPIYDAQQVAAYAQFCRDTIAALIRGATPMYFLPAVPDTNVNGTALMITVPGNAQELVGWKLAVRNEMPLQSTLYSLCQDLSQTLRRRGLLSGNYQVDVAIAHDTAMHGTVAAPELSGIDTSRRGILVSERNKNAWLFDASLSPDELLKQAAEAANVAEPQFAQIYSLSVLTTKPRVSMSSVPKPSRGDNVRAPGVAGKFYPGDPAEMSKMRDDLLDGDAPQESCKAVLVPHAGWQYSGRLAADVLKRVKFPKTIIAIGPKHTPHGVEWAVAPHHTWSLPGQNVESDYALARELANSIDGLEMDAAAHQAEHSIEVELPIIARLAPETRVVGIAIGGGSLDRCEKFAEGLASVIKKLDEPPLLLISSDMNHFANDDETRRLDAMALAELDRLDPDALHETVTSNHISMCGVLPAVIVMKTLQKLGQLNESRDIGYATSADVTGDKSRVVGYAGRIFQ